MTYQSKTSVICLNAYKWGEESSLLMSYLAEASVAAAVYLGQRCGMDLMSLSHFPREDGSCDTTLVYVNNGVTFEEIRRIMAPEIKSYPRRLWMFQDFEEADGILNCMLTVRDVTEKWS